MGSDQQFCLRWHNYQSSLLASLPQLLDSDDLTDVTLSAGGHNLKAHRVVLSACSQYFKELFKLLHPTQHPVIVLPGTNFTDLCALVTFMYSGEVNIYQEQLQGLLTMADAMQIRGLAEVNGTAASEAAKKDPSCSAPKRPKLAVPTPSSTLLNQNQLPSENGKCNPKPAPTEVVDMPLSSMKTKGSDLELFGNGSRAASTCRKSLFDSDHAYRSTSKEEGLKLKSALENVDPYTGSVRGSRYSKAEDIASSPPKPEETKVKSEPEVGFSCSGTEGSHSLPALENDIIPDRQSTSSEDSGGGGSCNTFGAEGGADRIQLSQGSHLSNLKLNSSSSPYNKLLGSNSKLYATCFVCGKQLSNQYNLRVHMETHQNVNYACSVCSHVSRSRDALRKHVSYRHPGEGTSPRKPKLIPTNDGAPHPQP